MCTAVKITFVLAAIIPDLQVTNFAAKLSNSFEFHAS